MPGSPEAPTFEITRPEDIIKEEGGKKVIPVEERFPPQAERYREKESIKKGEVASPITYERFGALAESIVGTREKPGRIERCARAFFGRDPSRLKFEYTEEVRGLDYPALKSLQLAGKLKPEVLRSAVFKEFVYRAEVEKAAFQTGRTPLGELSPEEVLAVEALFSFPKVILMKHLSDEYKKQIAVLRQAYYRGLSGTEIRDEQKRLVIKQKAGSASYADQERLKATKQHDELRNQVVHFTRKGCDWQRDLYKFVISNQNNPGLPGLMRSYFSVFERLGQQPYFKHMVGEKFLDYVPMLRAGALAPVTAAKVLESKGLTTFLPAEVESDTIFGIDLIGPTDPRSYLVYQVKHNNSVSGVDIDGEISYNLYPDEVRRLRDSAQLHEAVLGDGASVVPRFVVVGDVGEQSRYSGLPTIGFEVTGKTNRHGILERKSYG